MNWTLWDCPSPVLVALLVKPGPDERTVAAGTTVVWTWVNTGVISHSVESTGEPGFTSSATKTGDGQSHSVQFTVPGAYTYQCAVHGAAMSGTIVVQ